MMTESKTDRSAAITGAGSGLGRELALQLDGRGYAVFGTALSDYETEELRSASNGRIRLTIADITDEQAVHGSAEAVNVEVDGHGLDLLINNAGILTPGPLEVLPMDAIRREFEVNVFGAITVTNALLPSLRQGRGRIQAPTRAPVGEDAENILRQVREMSDAERRAGPGVRHRGRPPGPCHARPCPRAQLPVLRSRRTAQPYRVQALLRRPASRVRRPEHPGPRERVGRHDHRERLSGRFDFTSADFLRIENGLAAEHWDTVDYVRLYQSFGLLPGDRF